IDRHRVVAADLLAPGDARPDLGGLVAAHEDRVEVLVVVRQVDGGLLADWRAVARLALAQVGDQDAETALARLDGAVAWPAFRVAVVQELVQMGRRRDTADLDDARRLLRLGAWRRHNERAQQEKESHRNLLGSTSASAAGRLRPGAPEPAPASRPSAASTDAGPDTKPPPRGATPARRRPRSPASRPGTASALAASRAAAASSSPVRVTVAKNMAASSSSGPCPKRRQSITPTA